MFCTLNISLLCFDHKMVCFVHGNSHSYIQLGFTHHDYKAIMILVQVKVSGNALQ